MGCNCGGGGSGLGNYKVVYTENGAQKTKEFTAVRETEAKAFAAKYPGATYSKTS
jgi:hypothetical protein